MSAVELDKNNFEEELETVGENIKNLESSAEKALAREEKLVGLKGNACQLIKKVSVYVCVDILIRCKLLIS